MTHNKSKHNDNSEPKSKSKAEKEGALDILFRDFIDQTDEATGKTYAEILRDEFNSIDDDFDPVTAEYWQTTHPMDHKCGSDKYYADLANQLCKLINTFPLPASAPDGLARELGIVLSAYLEDIISETKIFSAMRRVCIERYGYPLPFFDCSHPDYMYDHINIEDITFLIWKTACQLGKENDMVYSPMSPGWDLIAHKIFHELNSRFETAPEARRVTDYMHRMLRREDYIEIRKLANCLLYFHPLTYTPGLYEDIIEGLVANSKDHTIEFFDLEKEIYMTESNFSWQRSMSPMGCPSTTLLAAIAKEFGLETEADDIENIQVFPMQVYAVSKQKGNPNFIFEAANHKKYEVERSSFKNSFSVKKSPYAKCVLLKFKGKYLLNGIMIGSPELKTEWDEGYSLFTYDQQSTQAKEWIDLCDGQQVICVSNPKPLLSKLGIEQNNIEVAKAKNYTLLISKQLGYNILFDLGYAFNIPGNRFYRKKRADKDAFGDIIFNNSIPLDVAQYIYKHNLLPDAYIDASQGKEFGRRIVQDYLSFWFGFYCVLPPYGDISQPKTD